VLRRVILQWFWDTYDGLGRLVVFNLLVTTLLGGLWFLGLIPGAQWLMMLAGKNPALAGLLGLGGWTFAGALTLTLWFPGILFFAKKIATEKEVSLRDYFSGLRLGGVAFFKVALLLCLALGIIGINLFFYARVSWFQGAWRWVGAGLAGLCFWMAFFVLAIALHSLSLAVQNERTPRQVFLHALLLTLRYPLFSAGALLVLGFLWVLSTLTLKTAPLWVIGLSATATFINSVHDVVLARESRREHEAAQAAKEGAPSPALSRPTSWRQILQDTEAENLPRDRYQRSLRDLLRPWDYR
jgi:hypothetical protein